MEIVLPFKRVSPLEFAQKVGIPMGWFLVSHRLLPKMKDRRELHGKWCRIESNRGIVYRVIRFSPRLQSAGTEARDIVIDWQAWIDLYGREEDVSSPIELTVTKARWFQYPVLGLRHPDPSYRLATLISLGSAVLGVLSVVLGVWSVCLAA